MNILGARPPQAHPHYALLDASGKTASDNLRNSPFTPQGYRGAHQLPTVPVSPEDISLNPRQSRTCGSDPAGQDTKRSPAGVVSPRPGELEWLQQEGGRETAEPKKLTAPGGFC